MRKINKIVLFVVVFLFSINVSAGVVAKNNKGNKSFNKKKYQEALKYYSSALIRNPESKILHYNLGSTYYKLNNYEKALEEYQKALGIKDKNIRSKVYYNIGNTYYRLGEYQKAIDSYIEDLKLNPDDKDAKYNIELIRKLLKNNSKKESQRNNMNNQSQKQNQRQKSGKQNKQDENKQKEQQQKKSGQDKNKLSKEEAERILNALQEDEKNTQKKKARKMKMRSGRYVEKDW